MNEINNFKPLELNLIVCIDSKGGIAKDSKIPWKIEEDYNYFRDIIGHRHNYNSNTIDLPISKLTHNVIIMGRNTYEAMSLVKNHTNIIVSTTLTPQDLDQKLNQSQYSNTKGFVIKTIEEALIKSKQLVIDKICSKIFVCGGKSIYDYCIEHYDRDVTKVYSFNHHLIYESNSYSSIQYNEFSLKYYITKIEQDYNCDIKVSNIIFNSLQILETQYHNEPDQLYHKIQVEDKITTLPVQIKIFKPILCKQTYEIEKPSNLDEIKYLNLMNRIINTGVKDMTRNGYTFSLFGEQLQFDLNSYPLLTTKKVYFKGVFEELLYFIRGQTNSKILEDKKVMIWQKNTTKDFQNSMNLSHYKEGDMGPMYGFQLRHFNAEYKGCDEDYNVKGIDQLSYIINLLKTDPKSRRMIMTTYNPAQAFEGVLFPCHGICIMFHAVHIEDNKYKLNIMQTQRSCDYFLGIPFNIASYALLTYMMCHIINNSDSKFKYEPGKLVMNLGDIHLYEEHIKCTVQQTLRPPVKFPNLIIKNKVLNLEEFKYEDFEVENYQPHLTIQAEMKQ